MYRPNVVLDIMDLHKHEPGHIHPRTLKTVNQIRLPQFYRACASQTQVMEMKMAARTIY